ncbi:MAG: hypothetical protein K1W41_21410, partial [Lachnospiraceae bacterium]
YIDLAPLYLKYAEKLQEKRFDFIKSLTSIIPENVVKVSKIKCFKPNQQTLIKTILCLKTYDILINDREFLSREILNYLKTKRKEDSYIFAIKNMTVFEIIVNLAKKIDTWQKHPNKKITDFKNTQYNYITYCIIITLTEYLYLHLY